MPTYTQAKPNLLIAERLRKSQKCRNYRKVEKKISGSFRNIKKVEKVVEKVEKIAERVEKIAGKLMKSQ